MPGPHAPHTARMALEELVTLLRCPRCHRKVRIDGPGVVCEGPSMHRFATQDGALIALPEDRDVVTMPVDHVSNQIDGEVLDWLDSLPGYSLNLGAGATTRRPSRCVELEYSVFANTTVVGDAHQLPFEDDVFDAVVSYNTFEHLADPAAAADEIYRVLKPGGSLRLQTAFLQPLHEEPAHFYNATEYGLRRWFSNFDIHDCFVPQNMIPPYALGWMSEVVLSAVGAELGPDERDLVAASRMQDWERSWLRGPEDPWRPSVIVDSLSQQGQHRACFGFELRASTPSRRHPTSEPARPAGAAYADAATTGTASSGRDPDRSPLGGSDAMPLEELVTLLRCPRCHRKVRIDGPGVVCEGPSMHRFATQDGALIALPEDRDVVTMPVDHVSNQIDGEVLDWLDSLPGYSLNLGAGATTRRPSCCVELEYSVFANTTVVGDAHQLPFEDDVFDAVVSYNTFEHLADPAAAADEIYRVLKPGGRSGSRRRSSSLCTRSRRTSTTRPSTASVAGSPTSTSTTASWPAPRVRRGCSPGLPITSSSMSSSAADPRCARWLAR